VATPSVARVGAVPVTVRLGWFAHSKRILGRDWPIAWLFILPTGVLLFGLIGYPFVRAAWLSLFNVVGVREGAFVGLQNYQNLWADDQFARSVRVTGIFTVASVAIKFVLGLSAALLLHNLPRWGAVIGGLILLPYIIPDVVRALAWRILLDPLFGGLNFLLVNVLHVMARGPSWLGDTATALPSIIGVNVWAGMPFFIILILAGLKSIDRELYDAAAVDGANSWRRFLHVTLPGLRYVIVIATLYSAILTANGFTLVYLLTGGGPGGATRVYPILAYEYAVQALRFSAGVAVALTNAPVMFLFILILGRFMIRPADQVGATADEGPVWRAVLFALWPLRLLLRGLTAIFWGVNWVVETILGAITGLLRQATSGITLSRRTTRPVGPTIMYVLIGALLIFELLPFYFVFVTSFKTNLQIQQIQNMFWPSPWTLEHFERLFTQIPFVTWYANTILVSGVVTAISLFAASLGAYALVRLKWRGSSLLGSSVLIAYLMPSVMMFIPLYAILTQLRLINSQMALIVTYPSIVLPFATWLLMGYYRSIPEELEDAAMIDGCNRFQTYYKVVLPLVRPALLAVAMFSVTQAWNEFLYAKTFLRSSEVLTLPVGLGQLIAGDVQPWGELMAASLLTALPVIVLYMLGQKYMIAGLTAGSVKG
jgi:multiple sugar transport system permease protein